MTRFRCAIVDEAGVAATRVIDARNRDQAVLLLLAEGVTPASITRDAPSLADRIGPAATGGMADILLQDLARLVASGFTIPEAAATIDGEPARRIAAGTPVGEVMADQHELPHWIGAALILAADRGNEGGALVEIADDAETIALRGRTIRRAWIEAGLTSAATAALLGAMILVDIVAGLALSVAIGLALRSPFDAFRQSTHAIRQANFLLIVGRLLAKGGALRDSIRIAATYVLADHERAKVDAALTARSTDDDLRTDIGRRLNLTAADRAIMAHGDAAQALRAVSAHSARSSMSAQDGLLTALRMGFAATVAVVLIWLVSR
jgi:type II secretory pathway component PulF